jgi:hypothetical protein
MPPAASTFSAEKLAPVFMITRFLLDQDLYGWLGQNAPGDQGLARV